ncbi:P-loop containing nucleoside triphosphate hydrolase protein [Paxillus ammoniavirescens]|nr:P-loop containing nucleoside triphosphate hydrolase protein [Paxillus ammoniavirescens]
MPSHDEVEAAKRRVKYTEGLFHFAVAGVAGGGKSSLINAFRGLQNRDKAAAPTGVTETTLAISRLPDPNKENPFVWYDIPGAGTLKIKDWQYFNEQGLYVFDCIIVVFDSRFTMTDIAMLVNCKRFGIPTYIVRSKSDSHIRNIMLEMGYDNDDNNADREALDAEAREEYIAETRANIKQNLAEANLPDQRVYMVSNSVLLSIVKGQTLPPKIIDELELMRDLLGAAHSRRCIPRC